MTQPAKSQEPSMEEILASIRRIIADDDASKTAQRAAAEAQKAPPPPPPPRVVAAPPPPPPPPEPEPLPEPEPVAIEEPSDILELTESMAAPIETPQFRTIDGSSDLSFAEEPPPPPPPIEEPAPAYEAPERLVSKETSFVVDSAFNSLAQTVLVKNARTLEDLVREMLRPLLKSWLDDNLPGMVERLVRAEIERVSRGR
jgi:uncharacterized protein